MQDCEPGTDIPVLVVRKVFDTDEFIPLTITAAKWEGGQGLIGCQLTVISPPSSRSSLKIFADKVTGRLLGDSKDVDGSSELNFPEIRMPDLSHFSFPPLLLRKEKKIAFAG